MVADHQPVTVEIVADSGTLPVYMHGASAYVEGRRGEHYAVRVRNDSPERIEAVVTVDGRDVVSGELGNFTKQRGYVIEPWGTVVVDGFRQSMNSVAAFRFSQIGDSYTTRRGTPQHNGVIGVAVFREKQGRRRVHKQPIAAGAPPPRAVYQDPSDSFSDSSSDSFPESEVRGVGARAGGNEAFAPAPEPRNEIGTAYGESRTSVVHNTRFRRQRKLRPDVLLTLRYDSADGLRARGVLPYDAWHAWTPVYVPQPEPFGPGPHAPPRRWR